VVATYQNSQLSIEIDYFLSGSGVGSGGADLTETIMAKNKSGGQLELKLLRILKFQSPAIRQQQCHNFLRVWGGTIMLRNERLDGPYGSNRFTECKLMPKLQISARHWMNSTPSLDGA